MSQRACLVLAGDFEDGFIVSGFAAEKSIIVHRSEASFTSNDEYFSHHDVDGTTMIVFLDTAEEYIAEHENDDTVKKVVDELKRDVAFAKAHGEDELEYYIS